MRLRSYGLPVVISHFYHAYATKSAYGMVAEHVTAIIESRLADHIDHLSLGVVGTPESRKKIIDLCYGLIPTEVVAEADEGWEQTTLNVLWERRASFSGPVLYAHTKGASQACPWNTKWRRTLTDRLVRGWQGAAQCLAAADVVGCNWISESFLPRTGNPTNVHFFAGNFWWASPDYLRKLAAPSMDNRWEAEKWIGKGRPRVCDLIPGFPSDVIR